MDYRIIAFTLLVELLIFAGVIVCDYLAEKKVNDFLKD